MTAPYRRKFLAEYMASDIKPRRKIRRSLEHAVRNDAKEEIRKALDTYHDSNEDEYDCYCSYCRGYTDNN